MVAFDPRLIVYGGRTELVVVVVIESEDGGLPDED